MKRAILMGMVVGALLLGGCGPQDSAAPGASSSVAGGSATTPQGGQQVTPVSTVVASLEPVGNDGELVVEDPVPIDSAVEASGIVVRIVEITAITTRASIPGEVAGPGLAVQLELRNDSGADIEIDSLVVTLYDATGAPAGMITSDSDQVFETLSPGEVLHGVFRYTIADELRAPITVEVSLPNHPSLLTFQGDAPRTNP